MGQEGSLRAGLLVWVELLSYVRQQPPSFYASNRGLAPFVKALAVVASGRAVKVTVPTRERRRLSLDYTYIQPRSQNGRVQYRVSDGVSTVTFQPCPASKYPGGRTQFAGGFIVAGPQCAKLHIQAIGSVTRMRRFVPFGSSCGALNDTGAAPRACSSADYRLTLGSDGAGGQVLGEVGTQLRGSSPCKLHLPVTFTVQQRDRTGWEALRMPGNPSHGWLDVLLRPGRAIGRQWGWSNYCNAPNPPLAGWSASASRRFRLVLSSGRRRLTTPVPPPSCMSDGTGPGYLARFPRGI